MYVQHIQNDFYLLCSSFFFYLQIRFAMKADDVPQMGSLQSLPLYTTIQCRTNSRGLCFLVKRMIVCRGKPPHFISKSVCGYFRFQISSDKNIRQLTHPISIEYARQFRKYKLYDETMRFNWIKFQVGLLSAWNLFVFPFPLPYFSPFVSHFLLLFTVFPLVVLDSFFHFYSFLGISSSIQVYHYFISMFNFSIYQCGSSLNCPGGLCIKISHCVLSCFMSKIIRHFSKKHRPT